MRNFFIFIITVIGLTSCSWQDVTVSEVQNIEVKGIEDNTLFIDVELVINNPNNNAYKVKNGDLTISVNGNELGTSHLTEGFKIEKNSSEKYTIHLSADAVKTLKQQLPSLLLSAFTNKIEVEIDGEIKGGVFIFSKTIPVHHKEKVNLKDLNLNSFL